MNRDDLRAKAEAARDAIAAHAALNEDEPAERRAYARMEEAVEALREAVTPDVVLALLTPERQADVSRSEERFNGHLSHCQSFYCSMEGEGGSLPCSCGKELRDTQAELTTARQEIAALKAALEAAREEQGKLFMRAFGADRDLFTLRAQHRVAVARERRYLSAIKEYEEADINHGLAESRLKEVNDRAERLYRQWEEAPTDELQQRRRENLDDCLKQADVTAQARRRQQAARSELRNALNAAALNPDTPDLNTHASPDPAPVGEAIDPQYVTRECPSCGENHCEASMCPPHEVRRGTGPWSRQPVKPQCRLDPAACRAQGHGRVACQRCGAEWVGLETVRAREA